MTVQETDATGRAVSTVDFESPATDKLVAFSLGDRRLGIPLRFVAEVHEVAAIAPAAMPGGGFVGHLDLRGQAVPVLDLRGALGQPVRVWDPGMHFIIVADGERRAAIAVDDVDGVVDGEIGSRDGGSAQAATSGLGVARTTGGLVTVVDAVRLTDLAFKHARGEAS